MCCLFGVKSPLLDKLCARACEYMKNCIHYKNIKTTQMAVEVQTDNVTRTSLEAQNWRLKMITQYGVRNMFH